MLQRAAGIKRLLWCRIFAAAAMLIFSAVIALSQTPESTPVPDAASSPLPAVSPTPDPEMSPADEIELVHFGDLISVDVQGTLENDWTGGINPEGDLDGANPYGDPIHAACRQTSAIAVDLEKAFSKFLRDPKVEVRIIDRSKRSVAVLDGAVRAPKRYLMRRPAKLRELIVYSGGITDDSSGNIHIVRPAGSGCMLTPAGITAVDSETRSFDIGVRDLISGNPGTDIFIRSGDLIDIERSQPVYMLGGVNAPRPIAFRGKLTLSRAVAMAGGLSKDAIPGEVTIYRREKAETLVINADLTAIEAGTAADPEIAARDIVNVGRKGREKPTVAPEVEVISDRNTQLPLKVIE